MNIFLKLIFLIFFTVYSYAENILDIKITGNKRISNKTILDKINFDNSKKYSLGEINQFQKILYETNFFKSVNMKLNKSNLIIKVVENPIINFYYLEGVVNKSREDFLNENALLGGNKIFTESLLKKDLEMISSVYRNAGYLDVVVKPVLTKLDNNSINLVIKIDRKEKTIVRKIYFNGNKNFNNSTLLNIISTEEDGWWKFLSSNTSLNINRIEYDKNLLKNFYLDNGYYDVQIVSSDINIIEPNKAEIVFSINSGNLYKFNNISIVDDEKNLNETNIKEIKNILSKTLKGNYSRKKLSFTRDLIFNYLNLNKIEFVNFNIIPSNKNDKIDLLFSFKKTNKAFVDLINISGNTITEEKVIRRNIIFSEGDSFIRYKSDKSLDNLKNTRIFKDIKIKENKITEDKVNLDIIVEEQPTGSISAGLGVGTSSSSVSTGLVERNLFGKGIVVDSNISFGTEKVSGISKFKLPDFKNTGNEFSYSLYATQLDYKNAGYESSTYGNDFSITYESYEDVFLNTGFGFDLDKIDTNASTSALYKSRDGNYLTLKTFYKVSSDKRNRKFNTTSGHITGFGQTLAMPGSDIQYIKNNIFGSKYFPVSQNFTLNLKAGATSINSLGNEDIKLSDRLFLSSSQLRGFESQGIGPKDNKDHVGGNYSAYSSISSTIPNFLPEKWNANSIVFLDAGNVWGVDYNDTLDSNKLRSSTGLAIDWMSPLGPLSFVFSQVLSSSNSDLEESFNFKLGSSF